MMILSKSATFKLSYRLRNSNMLLNIGRHEPRKRMHDSALGAPVNMGKFNDCYGCSGELPDALSPHDCCYTWIRSWFFYSFWHRLRMTYVLPAPISPSMMMFNGVASAFRFDREMNDLITSYILVTIGISLS